MEKLDKRDDSMHIGVSITDELRRFIEDPLLGYAPQEQHIKILTAIADRIDAEHDREMGSARVWQYTRDSGTCQSARLAETENAKLRELVRDYIDAPCTTCDCWQDEFRCWNYDGADCGLVARARELGVEVD